MVTLWMYAAAILVDTLFSILRVSDKDILRVSSSLRQAVDAILFLLLSQD